MDGWMAWRASSSKQLGNSGLDQAHEVEVDSIVAKFGLNTMLACLVNSFSSKEIISKLIQC